VRSEDSKFAKKRERSVESQPPDESAVESGHWLTNGNMLLLRACINKGLNNLRK
jgi:hypothetical protein